jgi:hypothetical protein
MKRFAPLLPVLSLGLLWAGSQARGAEVRSPCPPPGSTTAKESTGAYLTLAGGALTAIVALLVAALSNRNQRRVEQDRQAHQQELDRIKAQLAFAIELDKDLLERRARHYEDLVQRTAPLPRYPSTPDLSPQAAYDLATSLTSWYFSDAGLYMTPETKQFYFDLQDGLRVALAKVKKIAFQVPPAGADLRAAFDRQDGWEAPPALVELLSIPVPPGAQLLPTDLVERLTRLASRLRTELTKELLSRRKVDAADPFGAPRP